jgi:hypothetical protein
MHSFLIERTIPPAFDIADPAAVALHCRWAVDAYREVGAMWLGGVVTDDNMVSLVVAEEEADLRRYWASLGIGEDEVRLRRVLRPIGPAYAQPRSIPARPPRLR